MDDWITATPGLSLRKMNIYVVLGALVCVLVGQINAKSYHNAGKSHRSDAGYDEISPAELRGPSDSERLRREDARDRAIHPRHTTPGTHQASTGIDWKQVAQDELGVALNSWPKWQKAKNVIYFIGDGMGISTLTAARVFKAQSEGRKVTEGSLSWESFPYIGMAKTYNTDQQVPDSAGTATAFICGEKARDGVLCVNENVPEGDCDAVEGNELRSLLHMAMDAGKWGGIVTTTRITHATPAAGFAVSCTRNWEADSDVPLMYRDKCMDIAKQLVDNSDARRLRVILGGGRYNFFSNDTYDNEYPDYMGVREDDRDLRQDWLDYMASAGLQENEYQYVENKTDFNNVDSSNIKHLLGLFEPGHMKYEADRVEEMGDTWTEPSLAEMTKKALDILKRGPDGYFLYAEGGRIDHAHHDSNAHRALLDVVALQDAVQVAMDETSAEDTLIIVTADHSHVFTIGGYPYLENDVLGLVVNTDNMTEAAMDQKPFLTLQYANGPGWLNHRSADGTYQNETFRKDVTDADTTGKDYLQDSAIPLDSETHGGEDVSIYARGPMAHLFAGQHEQHYIAHAAGYASCVGWNTDFCVNQPASPEKCDVTSRSITVSFGVICFLLTSLAPYVI